MITIHAPVTLAHLRLIVISSKDLIQNLFKSNIIKLGIPTLVTFQSLLSHLTRILHPLLLMILLCLQQIMNSWMSIRIVLVFKASLRTCQLKTDP